MAEIDLDNTDKIVELFQIPKGDRDAGWLNDFFNAVPTAAFAVTEKEMTTGPEGFPYLALFIPPVDAEFRGFSIVNVLDTCLDKGVGAAIFPEAQGEAQWVFTYGNLLSYKLTGQFDARSGAPPAAAQPPNAPRQVLIAQPSEQYLPPAARASIRRFLEANGIFEPKVALAVEQNASPPERLVLSIYPQDFPNPETFSEICRRIGWYLPPHYVLATLPARDPQFEGQMAAL